MLLIKATHPLARKRLYELLANKLHFDSKSSGTHVVLPLKNCSITGRADHGYLPTHAAGINEDTNVINVVSVREIAYCKTPSLHDVRSGFGSAQYNAATGARWQTVRLHRVPAQHTPSPRTPRKHPRMHSGSGRGQQHGTPGAKINFPFSIDLLVRSSRTSSSLPRQATMK